MKKAVLILLVLCMGLAATAQNQRKSFILNKPVDELKAQGAFNVVYSHEVEKVTVVADAALMDKICVETLRNKPTVRIHYKNNTTVNIKGNQQVPTVYIPRSFNINEVELEGACTFSSTQPITGASFSIDIAGAGKADLVFDMSQGNVEVDISGAGKMEAQGTVKKLELDMSGAGLFTAPLKNGEYQLKTEVAEIDLTGACKASIHCTKHLEADCAGACKLTYTGAPSTDIETAGACSVKHR